MPSQLITGLVAGLALGATAGAIPPRIGTPMVTPGNSFSARQVSAPHYVRSGPVAMAKTYAKFGKQVPKELAATVAKIKAGHKHKHKHDKRATGSETTTPEQYDIEYLTPVSIGTPAQVLNLDFDTGSSDLWVFSSETETDSIDGQALYNPAKSSTSKKLANATWSITYGDGSSSSGDVYTDVVSIGGLTAKVQAVESAQTVSSQFSSDSASSGLLGLAFSSLNTVSPTAQTTFFDTVKSSLTSPVFTADLKHDEPGSYNFGFIDTSAYTGSLTYVSVDSSQGFWGFTSPGYAVGSGAFTKSSTSGIADTGTTLLLLPNAIVKAYYKNVSGAKNDNTQGGYVFPCTSTLPSFTFGVGSAKITIPSSYMNYAPISDNSTTCFGGLQSSSGIGINIFGDVALKAAFVVFDGGKNQLGWAAKTLS